VANVDWAQLLIPGIITGVFTVFSVFLKVRLEKPPKTQNEPKPKIRKWQLWKKIWVIIAIIVLIADIAVIAAIAVPATDSKTNVTITNPAAGSTVDMKETVQGTYANVPKDKQIWVIVSSPQTNRYYPMEFAATVQTNGDWFSQTTFGKINNNGDHFDVMAVLADQTCKNEINNYFNTAVNPTTDYYPGMTQLPSTATVYDVVSVTRNP
jgi:hypothetical protein